MIKYLNIILNDLSVFPCCKQPTVAKEITEEVLCAGIKYAEENNCLINIFYPYVSVSGEIQKILSTTLHKRVVPLSMKLQKGDVVIIDNWSDLESLDYSSDVRYIIRTSKSHFEKNWQNLPFNQNVRVDIVVDDVAGMDDEDFAKYHTILANMAESMTEPYTKDNYMHCNVLTDRISLKSMHNCGAGDAHITLAPDGEFYICPAFYFFQMRDLGSVFEGVNIKNEQLYSIDYAPICKHCDAFHCKRCIWLNKKLTLEVNTPSHEQCVVSHIERNASRQLFLQAQSKGGNQECDIPELPYLDPFEERLNWLK